MAAPSHTAPSIAHDIRQLFAHVGIPEKGDTSAGGYQLMENGTQVRVMWWAEASFDHQSGDRGVDHPDHPLVRVERATSLAMDRAMADVLYAAGLRRRSTPC